MVLRAGRFLHAQPLRLSAPHSRTLRQRKGTAKMVGATRSACCLLRSHFSPAGPDQSLLYDWRKP